VALGYRTKAIGNYSFANGNSSIAKSFNSFVVGRYNDTTSTSLTNWILDDPLFIIGNGDWTNNSNAMTVLKNGNVGLGPVTPVYKLQVSGAVMLEDTPVPAGLVGHSGIFSDGGELHAIDAIGNSTVISPHNFSLFQKSEPMAWSFYSENSNLKQKIGVDMLKVIRIVEKLSGENLIVITDLEGNYIKSDLSKEETIEEKLDNLIEENQEMKATIIELQQEIIDDQNKKIEQIKSDNEQLKARLDKIENY
jgi:hypothetical protein